MSNLKNTLPLRSSMSSFSRYPSSWSLVLILRPYCRKGLRLCFILCFLMSDPLKFRGDEIMSNLKNTFSLCALLVCFVLNLAGCVLGARVDADVQAELVKQTTFTPQTWATSVDEAKLQSAQHVDWLASFQDEVLTSLVKETLVNNYDLMAASANVKRSQALAVQAGAQLAPQIGLSLSSTNSGLISGANPNSSSQSLSLQVNWELDLWGRISAGQNAAMASAEAAAADYAYAQHSLAAATARAYFVAIEAGQQVGILQETIASLGEAFRIVNVQYENGLISTQDVALTNTDLASARAQLIVLQASQRDALRALEVLLGRYPRGDIALRTGLPMLPPMPPLGVPSNVLERRPDLIASERQVAAAFNNTAQAKAAQLPQFSLTGSLGGSSNSLSNIANPSNAVWQLMSNLLAPIFDGGARSAQVDVATAEQEQALATYAQTALQAFNEVETNLDLANTLVQRDKEIHLALTEIEKAYRIASLRYKGGEIALIDLLSIQQRVLSAKSNKSSVQRLALEQRVNLYLALGGNWAEHTQE